MGEHDRGSWRGRTQNSDTGRWYDRGDMRDPRGLGARASDEVRSWFGDEEAERRREQDARAYERQEPHRDRAPGSERSGSDRASWDDDRQPWGDGGYEDDRSYGTRRSFGQAGYGTGGRDDRFTSHHDEAYRRWRDQRIAELDRDYEEYCRERQQRFDSDFDSFRQGRQASGASGEMSLGQGGGRDAGSSGLSGTAAATTTGAGSASAATSSTGSSDTDWGSGQAAGGGESGSGARFTSADEPGAGPTSDADGSQAGSSRS